MGPDPAKVLTALVLLGLPAVAQEPGWHYSPLPGEGDRATLGCDREATATRFTCLAVRCEDDFSTGIHIHSDRPEDAGTWHATFDRENATLAALADDAPYGARIDDPDGWLLDRLRQGTFVYLRHDADADRAFRYIDLSGSLQAIHQALAFCAPRKPAGEPIADTGV